MHVEVDFVDLVAVICPKGTATTNAALKKIIELDPPSKGVPMHQVELNHIQQARIPSFFDEKQGAAGIYVKTLPLLYRVMPA